MERRRGGGGLPHLRPCSAVRLSLPAVSACQKNPNGLALVRFHPSFQADHGNDPDRTGQDLTEHGCTQSMNLAMCLDDGRTRSGCSATHNLPIYRAPGDCAVSRHQMISGLAPCLRSAAIPFQLASCLANALSLSIRGWCHRRGRGMGGGRR